MATHNNLLFSWNNVEQLPEFQRLKLVLDNLPDEAVLEALQQQRGRGRNDFPVQAMCAQQLRESSFNTIRSNIWYASFIATLDYCSFAVFIRCHVKVRRFTSFATIPKPARANPAQSGNHASIRSPTNGTLHASSSG